MKWRKTAALVKYQLRIYVKENRFLMPLVVMLVLLYFMYSISPVDVVSSFSLSCYIIFSIMVWIGYTVSAAEDLVMEQIEMLRVESAWCYYMGKVLFVFVLGFAGTCLCLFFPVAVNMIKQGQLFDRQLTLPDLLHAFFLLLGSSFAGGALGSILHPTVMRERKMALLLTILAAVLTIIKGAAVQEISVLKWITWVLPPVNNVMGSYGHAEYFSFLQTLKIFLFLMTYGIIYSMIKSAVSYKRKFG